MRHCDEYIDDPTQPECLRAYLTNARAPASFRVFGKAEPTLFATFKGQRVRVVMASRFGDVGISANLEAAHGYSERVGLEDLSDFSAALTPAEQEGGAKC